jgi:hypothetical protein
MYLDPVTYAPAFERKMASERLLVAALVVLGLTVGLSTDGGVLNGISLLLACSIAWKIYQRRSCTPVARTQMSAFAALGISLGFALLFIPEVSRTRCRCLCHECRGISVVRRAAAQRAGRPAPRPSAVSNPMAALTHF